MFHSLLVLQCAVLLFEIYPFQVKDKSLAICIQHGLLAVLLFEIYPAEVKDKLLVVLRRTICILD